MPGISPRYDIHDETINDAGDAERRLRAAHIDESRAYFHGQHPRPLHVPYGEKDDNVILNVAGGAVGKLVSLLGVPDLRSDDPDEQAAVDAFWTRNDLGAFMADAALSAMIAGHGFWRAYLDADGSASVAALDPRLVTAFWDASDRRRTLFYRLDWRDGETECRQDIVRAELLGGYDVSGGWWIIEYRRGPRQDAWTEITREPAPFSPIVGVKNEPHLFEYYGRGDLSSDVRALNDALNFVASNTARIIKYHAHPRTVLVGGDLSDVLETRVDGVLALENPDARVENLEMRGDLGSSLTFMDTLRAATFAQMGVVDVSTQRDRLGQLSNFGVRVLYADTLAKLSGKRARFGAALADLTRRALALEGLDAAVSVTWPDPLPVDRREVVETARIEQDLGLTSDADLSRDLGREG